MKSRNTPSLKNGRDSTNRSVRLCFHKGPSRGVFQRKMFTKEKKSILFVSTVDRNAAFSRFLITSSVSAFMISIKYVGTIFVILEAFKEFLHDLMLESHRNIFRK